MLLIDKTFEIVTEESAESGDVEDAGFSAINERVTFRELVEMMRYSYIHASQFPVIRSTRVWFTSEPEQNYRTGKYLSESIHFSESNPRHKAKYWVRAMKCAGLRFADQG